MPSSLCGLCAILAQFPETSALPLTPTPAGTSQSSVLARPDFENCIARIPLNGSKFNLVSFFFFPDTDGSKAGGTYFHPPLGCDQRFITSS